jgi:DUF4097 and DUF4098 domain-containing protein YvlB
MVPKYLLAALFALMIIPLPAAAQEDDWGERDDWGDEEYSFQEQFTADLSGISLVKINIVSGGITVETLAGNSIEIEVNEKLRKCDAAEAEEIANEVSLVGRPSGSKLIIELEYGNLDEQYVHKHYSSALTVKVPQRLSLDLNTVSGGIRIARMEGDVTAEAVSGGITLQGCGGDADLETVSGGIECGAVGGTLNAKAVSGGLDLVGGKGDIEGETVSGGITILLPQGVGYDITASTFSGKVTDSLGGGFRGDYDRKHKRVRGSYGDGQYKVYLRTVSGGVTIKEK